MSQSRFLIIFIAMCATACAAPAPRPATPADSAPTIAVSRNASLRLNVVSTVSPLVNIIFNIGGDKINLVGVIPEGTDSHTFEPAPSDAVTLAKGDLIFVNGLDLETPTTKLAQANKKAGTEIVMLGELTLAPEQYIYDFSFPKEKGKPNPHLWMNPLFALRYAEITKDQLARRDPGNAAYYSANYEKLKARINQLDAAISQVVESIPPKQRKLLTYHDSFAYFAQRYPVQVIGAIQPADFAEPSARDVARLIAQVKSEGVPAIFGSEVFPSKVLEQIGRETKVRYIDSLRDDELPGKKGERNHSYFGLLIEDVTIIASALGGDPAPLTRLDPTNIPGSDAEVEQIK